MDNKNKKIQIPFETFISLLMLTGELLKDKPNIDFEEVEKINNVLNKKIDAIEKRNLYTEYKTALSEEKREEARKKYIDKANINKNFRY